MQSKVSFLFMNPFQKSGTPLKDLSTLLLLSFLFSGCGSGFAVPAAPDPASTDCQPGVAQILIGDGFLKPTCGCIGPGESGKVVSENLVCTLASGTTRVFFYLWGTQISHQILSTGNTAFLSSPVMNLNTAPQLSSFVVSFSSPGTTYSFKEAFTGMTGQFFVP